MSGLLSAIALALYACAAYGFARAVAPREPQPHPSPAGEGWPRMLLLCGVVAQCLSIGAWCITTRRSPFASAYGTLDVTAWAVAIAVAALNLRGRLAPVSGIAALLACVVLAAGMEQIHGPVATTSLLSSRIVSLHVLAILASFGLLTLAFGSAALYVAQDRMLKSHRARGMLRRLPPLETLDRVAYRAVLYAFPLLTVGLALGFARVFTPGAQGPATAWLADPHTLASVFTWCLYVAYLVARVAAGWRGVRLQYLLLAGMVIVFGLYVVPTTLHRFS